MAGVGMGACIFPTGTDLTLGGNQVTGTWIWYIAGGVFRDHVQLLRIESPNGDAAKGLRLTALQTKDWAGRPTLDLPAFRAKGEGSKHGFLWRVRLPTGDTAVISYQLTGDTVNGTVALRRDLPLEGPYQLFGMRIDPALLSAVHAQQTGPWARDSLPAILVSIHDARSTDRAFLQEMVDRGLVGQLAIPTQLVGGGKFMTWPEIQTAAAMGFGVAAHSRYHWRTDPGLQFMAEVVGSLEDMAAHGLATTVFTQPGRWRSETYFDSVPKFQTWRGSLLRTVGTALEAYTYPPSAQRPIPDSLAWGFGHHTLDRKSQRLVLDRWTAAQRRGRFTQFVIHTANLPSPGTLDWFLDTLAAAQEAGRIRVVHSITDVLRVRP